MRNRAALAAWISMAVLGGLEAFGQGAGEGLEAPWRWAVRSGVVYDDNRDGTRTNLQGNLDVYIEPRLDYEYRDADRTRLDVTLMPQLKWRSNPRTTEEGGSQRDTALMGFANLEGMHRLTTRLTLTAGDSFNYTDDPQGSEYGTMASRSESYFVNTAHAGGSVELTPEMQAEINAKSVVTRYEGNARVDEMDSDITSGEGVLSHKIGTDDKIMGLFSASEYQDQAKVHSRGSSVLAFNAGREKMIKRDVVCRMLAGYQSAQYDNSALRSSHLLNCNSELIFQAAAPTRYRVGAGYGFKPPNVGAYSLQKTTYLNAAVDHDVVADRLTMSVQARYANGRYGNEGPGSPGGLDRELLIGFYGTYYLNHRWSLKCGYSYDDWASDLRESFKRNQVDLSVKVEL